MKTLFVTRIDSRLLDEQTDAPALCFSGYSAEVPVAEVGQSPGPLRDPTPEAQDLYTRLQTVSTHGD
jgi:hypothetical protein